jgi:predicted RNA-binding protein with PIN domain
MTGWPEAGASEQRRRLVAALGELAARTATPVEVVFDGAEVDAPSVRGSGRQLVRVRFSSPGVEADDVVLDLAGRIPAATPVIVASSDKRVRDGARRLGANLLHAHQLIASCGAERVRDDLVDRCDGLECHRARVPFQWQFHRGADIPEEPA